MSVDGNRNKRIGNLDALSIFFKILATTSVQVETRLQALKYLQVNLSNNHFLGSIFLIMEI